MTASTIDAQLEFDFRGEHFCLSASIDLDLQLKSAGTLPPIYTLIARANQIDPYSYQYEVMEMAEIAYSNPQGLAARFCSAGHFDAAAFVTAWQAQQLQHLLAPIAQQELGIDNLAQHPDLVRALTAAYHLGQNQRG